MSSVQKVCISSPGTSLTFNIAETSITFPFHKDQARQLSSSITELIQTFAAKQKAERPKRWKMMEYKYQSEHGSHAVQVI
jgi:bisphosphoglycerate-independent phosphoglycerate mutase (AlkP superfamily)